jgi:hypothetical protein
LYHGEISGTGKRLYTADETLFLFEEFCMHHYKDPQKKDDVDAVRAMVQAGGEQCEWNVVARRIAREHPNEYGEQHPAGAISRQALKYRIRHYLLESSASGFVGGRRAIPEQVIAMIITTISAILATHSIIFTISLLRPIALGIIAAAGCEHLLTDGGAGRFNCSRFWLGDLFKKEKWSFRKPQSNSRKLPSNWKELVHDMVLPAIFLVVTFTIPIQLFVNADHTGILHVQVKGSGWFRKEDEQPEMQGHGQKNQFTCVVGTSADGSTLPAQLIFQGKTVKSLPSNMQYKKSIIPEAAGGRKKERQAAVAAPGLKPSKMTASFVPDFEKMDHESCEMFSGLGSLAVTHDHWADVNTSKTF